MFGPCNPNFNEAYPETILDIAPGTKNGEIFFGPFSASFILFSSMVPKPPIPDPIETPNFDKSVSSRSIRESSIHSFEATRPY